MLKILRRPEQFWETLEAVVTVGEKNSEKSFLELPQTPSGS